MLEEEENPANRQSELRRSESEEATRGSNFKLYTNNQQQLWIQYTSFFKKTTSKSIMAVSGNEHGRNRR
jgi:hypothetical protein